MKRIYLLLAVIGLGCLALGSCSDNTDNNENIDNYENTGGEAAETIAYTGYLVNCYTTGYTGVTGCKVGENRYGELPENSITALILTCDGNMSSYESALVRGGECDEGFTEYANKYGEYCTYDGYTFIGENISITDNIIDIKIWAVNDYNENYTASSELTDIARLTYASFEPFISNGYELLPEMELNPLQEGGIPIYDPTFQFNVFPYYNVTLPKDGENPIVLPSILSDCKTQGTIACVSFLEAPTTTTPQFEVSVTFEDGTVISGSFEIEL